MQLYLDYPCTSFPRSFARDYKETYRYPPPSTVYGLLLSLVGEVDMDRHRGVKLAIGLIGDDPPISRIVHKINLEIPNISRPVPKPLMP